MPHAQQNPNVTPGDVVRALRDFPVRWVVPTVLVTVLAAAFALFGSKQWAAVQALIVRSDALAEVANPGEFRHDDTMKVTQETILEVLKSQSVVSAALTEVGPPEGYDDPQAWPTMEDINALRGEIKLSAPNGSEFGKTEVFYLNVKAATSERAVKLTVALTAAVKHRFQELRDDRAQSLIKELEQRVALAREEVGTATNRLAALELSVGSDLAELRSLHGSSSSNSELRQQIVETEKELRDAESSRHTNAELLKLLCSSEKNAGRLLATPNKLLELQPALRRLKDGLIDAQLRTSKLMGQMTDEHPKVRAALRAEKEISDNIQNELAVAIRGIEVDVRLTDERVATLQKELDNTHGRLQHIASLRAKYTNLVAEVDHQTVVLANTTRDLSMVRASHATAQCTSLISTVDAPESTTKPLGPRKAVVVLVGLVGGLAIGMGVLFLTIPPAPRHGDRRRSQVSPQMVWPVKEAMQEEVLVANGSVSF